MIMVVGKSPNTEMKLQVEPMVMPVAMKKTPPSTEMKLHVEPEVEIVTMKSSAPKTEMKLQVEPVVESVTDAKTSGATNATGRSVAFSNLYGGAAPFGMNGLGMSSANPVVTRACVFQHCPSIDTNQGNSAMPPMGPMGPMGASPFGATGANGLLGTIVGAVLGGNTGFGGAPAPGAGAMVVTTGNPCYCQTQVCSCMSGHALPLGVYEDKPEDMPEPNNLGSSCDPAATCIPTPPCPRKCKDNRFTECVCYAPNSCVCFENDEVEQTVQQMAMQFVD